MTRNRLLRVTLLGALTGLVAGGVVLAFRWLIVSGQAAFLPGGEVGNYEGLEPRLRFMLPVASGLVLGALFAILPDERRVVGVIYVIG